MKAVVSALIALSLILVIGCDNNDDNIVNKITKDHNVYPIFHLKIDNGYRTFGVDSVQLIPNPTIGWPEPVYSGENGFIGSLASASYVDYIDSVPDGDTIRIDTTWVEFGFTPLQPYDFSFNRGEPFIWLDSFRADYAISVESLWVLMSADTIEVTIAPDSIDNPPIVVLDWVENNSVLDFDDPPPNDTIIQELLYGFWFDTARVIAVPVDTANYPPDSTYLDTVYWGLWDRIDSFFLAPDSSIWCNLDSTVIVEDTRDANKEFPYIVVDTLEYYGDCDARIDSLQERIYKVYGWGVYPGGDEDETPIPTFDTAIHFTFPDTAKFLYFDNGALSVRIPEVGVDTTETTWTDMGVSIEYIHDGVSTNLDSLTINSVMPPVEIFPEYDFIIREIPLTK